MNQEPLSLLLRELAANPADAGLLAAINRLLAPAGLTLSLGLRTSRGVVLGDHWVLAPPLPAGIRVGIVSSRIGRELQRQRPWFNALRAVVQQLSSSDSIMVTAERAAGARFIRSAGELYAVPTICFYVPDRRRADPTRWLRRQIDEASARVREDDSRATRFDVWVSPLLAEASTASGDSAVPLRDRVIWEYSDELRVLSMRRGGAQQTLLELSLQRENPPCVWVAGTEGAEQIRRRVGERVAARDAGVSERIQSFEAAPVPRGTERAAGCRSDTSAMLDCWSRQSEPLLCHWTRACPEPWPGQSDHAFVDQLLRNEPGCEHTALDTLCRILEERLLRASSRAIRGSFPVVAFTEVSPLQWPALRVFRTHRVRWDFEPYGIALSRRWLQSRGARPVIYGDDQVWDRLGPRDRPFFQQRNSSQGQAGQIDWGREREWRMGGDVRLPREPVGFVFVADPAQIPRIVSATTWPVLAVSELMRATRPGRDPAVDVHFED